MTETHWHVGKNMVGYLPESDVLTAETLDNARGMFTDMLEHERDSLDYMAEDDDESEGLWLELDTALHTRAWNICQPEGYDILADFRSGQLHYWMTACTDTACAEEG